MNELLTPQQMGEADRRTIEGGIPGLELMHKAGQRVYEVARRYLHPGSRLVVMCGPGNNGGDGFVVARLAASDEFDVAVGLLGDAARLKGDARQAFDELPVALTPLTEVVAGLAELRGQDVIVDALFGAGLSRGLEGEAADIVQAMNASEAECVAVDLPSGVNGASGEALGAAVEADVSVSFFRGKPGHYLMPGRSYAGDVVIGQIGIEADVLEHTGIAAYLNGPTLWGGLAETPPIDGHKYSRGHTVVVSGSEFATGASRLAALAAQRAGSGLVSVAAEEAAARVHAAHLTSVMIKPCDQASDLERLLADARLNSVVIGPAAGVGERTCEKTKVCLAGERAVVLDADALTSFEEAADVLFDLIGVSGHAGQVVLTPHEGEFSRLFPDLHAAEGLSKVERTVGAARRSGAVVVLKGPDTVIAAPDGRTAINASGTPWLATAGSGDVLAGMIAGYLAQGLDGFEAAAKGVWVHGRAGELAGPGLIAEDLIACLPGVVEELVEHSGTAP